MNFPYRVVFFDLDGTISDYHSAAENILQKMIPVIQECFPTVKQEHFFKQYWSYFRESELLYRDRKIDMKQLQDREFRFKQVLLATGCPMAELEKLPQQLAEIYDEGRQTEAVLFDYAVENLKYVRENCRTGVITQGNGENQRGQLQRLGVLDLFDLCCISSEIGYNKPDERLYQSALELARIRPKEALMVGDRLDWDLEPAYAVGMDTVLFTENSLYYEVEMQNHPAVNHVVHNHWQLQLLLRDMAKTR